MRPSFLVRLDKFPLNANGKLDRKALAAPDAAAYKKTYAAPRTEAERLLCGEFSQLLGVENIGLDDDFFALGGDSILAMRLTVFLAEKLAELPVSELKACPTPRLLAARLSAEAANLCLLLRKQAKQGRLRCPTRSKRWPASTRV
jgi:acyl carrier protein